MKISKKTLYIAIAFVCILAVSIFVTVKNKDSASLAPADNQKLNPSSEVVSSNTKQETYLPFKYEETEEVSEESPAEEKAIEVDTTTTRAARKDTSTDGKPSETQKGTNSSKVTTTTKNTTTTKSSATHSSKVQSTTETSTETTIKKILYYYKDGTTGYTPKPGAKYYENYCWQFVPGNTVTDEEIKEANKYCKHCGREDCLRFWINGDECPDCGVFVPVDVCHHC